jgi:hypothetical protein
MFAEMMNATGILAAHNLLGRRGLDLYNALPSVFGSIRVKPDLTIGEAPQAI